MGRSNLVEARAVVRVLLAEPMGRARSRHTGQLERGGYEVVHAESVEAVLEHVGAVLAGDVPAVHIVVDAVGCRGVLAGIRAIGWPTPLLSSLARLRCLGATS